MSETKHMPGRDNGTATKMTRMVAPDDAGTGEDVKLTPLRQAVLQTLVAAGRPLGAYDLLTEIETTTERRLMPPSVYRALEFLRDHGMVARIECLNAFLAMGRKESMQADAYFICDQCGSARAVECPALGGLIEHQATLIGFKIRTRIIEMKGICERCQDVHAAHPSLGTQF